MKNKQDVVGPNESLEIHPIKEKVYGAIKEKIIDFSYKPGQQLIEQNLSNEFGVSKSPVREALHRLEGDGLVQLIPYRGAFVTSISMKEFEEIYQLREALEIYCLEKGMLSYSKEDIEKFRKIMELSKYNVERKEATKAIEDHLAFHYLLVRKMENKLIEDSYARMHTKMKRYLRIAIKVKPERITLYNTEHYRILEAMGKGNVSSAVDELRNHLSHVVESFLTDEILHVLP